MKTALGCVWEACALGDPSAARAALCLRLSILALPQFVVCIPQQDGSEKPMRGYFWGLVMVKNCSTKSNGIACSLCAILAYERVPRNTLV